MKKSILCCVLLLSLLTPLVVRAVIPESGMYYDSVRQGLGYYVEVQGTTLVLIAFSFDQSSKEPNFYYAAGKITQSEPGFDTLIDPPIQMANEFPYQFAGPLYEFDDGPCITCNRPGWNTATAAKQAGRVYIRFADENRLFIGFTMNDGSKVASYVRRQQFGRKGYVVRNDGPILDPVPTPLYSFLGTWVFTDHADQTAQAWKLIFDQAEGPDISGEVFGVGHGYTLVSFFDISQQATLKCIFYGCGVARNDMAPLLMKFWDIGSDRVLGYIGDRLWPDDQLIYYRSDHLVTGVRITDPIPDAPPPPTE